VKKTLIAIALIACAFGARAQGTFDFKVTLTGSQEVPPNSDPTVGTGTFSLTGNSLSFLMDIPAVTFISVSASINGPALAGSNGPQIFDLGGPVFHSGNSLGTPPFYSFGSPFDGVFGAGPFTLTDQQINELESGLWYVNVTSAAEPSGQLRGQLLQVPEPGSLSLLLVGVGVAGFRRNATWRRKIFRQKNN
jgi:hypothetical protein